MANSGNNLKTIKRSCIANKTRAKIKQNHKIFDKSQSRQMKIKKGTDKKKWKEKKSQDDRFKSINENGLQSPLKNPMLPIH